MLYSMRHVIEVPELLAPMFFVDLANERAKIFLVAYSAFPYCFESVECSRKVNISHYFGCYSWKSWIMVRSALTSTNNIEREKKPLHLSKWNQTWKAEIIELVLKHHPSAWGEGKGHQTWHNAQYRHQNSWSLSSSAHRLFSIWIKSTIDAAEAN